MTIIWSFLSGVLTYGFLCNFRTMLISPILETPIDHPEQILEREMSLMTYTGGEFWKGFLNTSDNPTYRKLAELMDVPSNETEMRKWLVEDVLGAGTRVYMSNTPLPDVEFYLGDYYYSKSLVGGVSPWYHWVINKKWHLNDELNEHLIRWQQVGWVLCSKDLIL